MLEKEQKERMEFCSVSALLLKKVIGMAELGLN